MAENTPNLGLYKKNPATDGNDTFNIQTMLNENWDKLDEKVATKDDIKNIDLSTLATKEEVKTVSNDLTTHKNENATEHQRLALEDTRLHGLNSNLQREVAYLKLKQEASERIEGGTTFADDMNENRFGIELDEVNSQNIVIRDGSMSMIKREIAEQNVNDSTVINQAYSTLGSGGRKLVKLSNGWLVAAVDAGSNIYLYKSTDNGLTWEKIPIAGGSDANVSIASYGNNICVLTTNGSGAALSVYSRIIDVVTETVIDGTTISIDTNQYAIVSSTLIVNEEGTEIHAAWTSKNSTYNTALNIRYAKGIINTNGIITWGAVEQVTMVNSSDGTNYNNPSILLDKNGTVGIVATYNYSSVNYVIFITKAYTNKNFNSSEHNVNWGNAVIYAGSSSSQACPSVIFVPQSVNGLADGRMWVAWHGKDSLDTSVNNLHVAYSDDGGVTWPIETKLTSGKSFDREYPTLTCNKNGEVFIVHEGTNESSAGFSYRKYSNNAWGLSTIIRTEPGNYPSTLFDLSLDFTEPLLIYVNTEKVGFYGTWMTEVEIPTTTALAVYNLPSTNYVGAFVKKEGNVNIDAYINDVVMDKSLENDEYMFTKDLPSEAPIKLRLELSRDNISGGSNDKVTRILGGRS